ncbi:protein WVD2-like 7 isoform X2 [Eutrema salsugineum]|uniref:protein WVD2-like 7 isoform X2 n=1 Tax=Eutrema salsugineum TaxID=72664 RepID=UPI000CED0537|nr:protein WVD2-like 7 isoform X2 [Eutrema salsugineum]
MAGSEIQEPFSLSFQANSIHSGSISFGRFEKEGISWEKRSSFSHNRYLEEVDKCSKPGSVTEMKAHFEAHFKKKGIRFPASLESQTWGVPQKREPDDNDDDDAVYATESFDGYRSDGSFTSNYSHEEEKCGRQGKSDCEYDEGSDHCVSYDEIVVNSDDVIELDVPLDNDEVSVECTAIKEVGCEDLGPHEIPLEIEVRDCDEHKEESRLDQNLPENPSDVKERPSSSSASGPKPLENIPHAMSVTKVSTKRHDVTPKAASRRTKGSPLTSYSKINVDAKSQKESRPMKTVQSQPPTSNKTETPTPLARNRCKAGSYSGNVEMSARASGFRFKCSERAEKRKEFYMKLEEKIHAKKNETNQVQAKTQQMAEAEMKQFRKSLNFKATPMPSFYNTDTRPRSHNKTEPSKVAPPRPRHTTSASVTNRSATRVGYKDGFEEGKTVKKIGTLRSGN